MAIFNFQVHGESFRAFFSLSKEINSPTNSEKKIMQSPTNFEYGVTQILKHDSPPQVLQPFPVTSPVRCAKERKEELASDLNRRRAEIITKGLSTVVHVVTETFHKQGEVQAPEFLWQYLGVYVVRSVYRAIWSNPEMEVFFIGGAPKPVCSWIITPGQQRLRYAMIKEFEKKCDEFLHQAGYPNVKTVTVADVLYTKQPETSAPISIPEVYSPFGQPSNRNLFSQSLRY